MALRRYTRILPLVLLMASISQAADPSDSNKNPFDKRDEFGKKVRDIGQALPEARTFRPPIIAIDVREHNRPLELVLDTGGRTAACDVLRFSPDGKYLYAAGDDKVVRLWPFDPATGRLDVANARTLRWATFLQQRGSIYATAVDAEWKYMAVAGFGLRTGAVALIDLRHDRDNPAKDREGTVLAGITRDNSPTGLKRYPNPKDQFDQVIWSLALSPDGKQVAIGNDQGRVWVWEPARKDSLRPLGTVPDRASEPKRATPVRFLRYTDDTTVLAIASNGHVVKFDASKTETAPRPVFRFDVQDVRNVAYDPVQKRLAVFPNEPKSSTGVVEVRKEDGSDARLLDLPRDCFPQTLTFDPQGKRLAVGYYTTPGTVTFNKYTGAGVQLYDLKGNDKQGTKGPANSYLPEALTFDRTGKYLAVAGGSDQEVTVHDLDAGKEASRVMGVGRSLWGAAFSADAKSTFIAFRAAPAANPAHPNARGEGPWKVFNRLKMAWATAAETEAFKPMAPLESFDGWEIVTDPQKSGLKEDGPTAYHWTLRKGGKEYPLSWTENEPNGLIDPATKKVALVPRGLIRNEDGKPRCYTFVKPAGDSPVRLVVGHYWGLSVFELRDDGPALTRKLIGHQGEVMSVCPSADGKLLLTASRDQTLACWSLEPFEHHAALGASFYTDAKGVFRVDKVAPGSPAWEAGLVGNAGNEDQPGDEVLALAEGLALVPKQNWQTRLKAAQPGQSLTFYLRRVGSQVGVGTVCSMKQRPLFVFFPQRGDEWVAWRYYGYSYDCSTNGDFAIGWQLSRDVDGTPRFDRAEQYRKKFHRPRELRTFMANLALPPEAANVLDFRAPDARVTPETGVVSGSEDKVRVAFTAQAIGDLPAHKVTSIAVWVNDFLRYEQKLDSPRDGLTHDIDLPRSALRQGLNIITLQAFTKEEVRGQHSAEVVVRGPATQPDLYVLSVGINRYKDSENLVELRAGRDAEGIASLWKEQEGRVFRKVHEPVKLIDQAATRDAILGYLDRLTDNPKLRPDDVLVVFLAGHGTSKSELERVIEDRGDTRRGPRNIKLAEDQLLTRDEFIFCTHDIELAKPRTTGVTGKDLHERLKRLPCRKVVLLDTCHSGTVDRDPIRELVPAAVGPVILSACAHNQEAAENERLGRIRAGDPDTGDPLATGLFSIALVQAMKSRFEDADTIQVDEKLDAEELRDFVLKAVPSLLSEITGKEVQRREPGDSGSGLQLPAYFLPNIEKRLGLARKPPE